MFLSFQQQSPILFPDQRKMVLELKEISDVSNALKAVEISIGFLTSTITPADKEQPYEKYLNDVLMMDVEKYLPSRKVQNCTFNKTELNPYKKFRISNKKSKIVNKLINVVSFFRKSKSRWKILRFSTLIANSALWATSNE